MTHATPRPFDIDDDGFVNFDATGYSVEAYKIKPLLDTLDEAKAALQNIDRLAGCQSTNYEDLSLAIGECRTIARAILTDLEG